MKISEFFELGINPITSYMLGLTFPFIKTNKIDGVSYIFGSVSHKLGTITCNEILIHFAEISKLLTPCLPNITNLLFIYNDSPIYGRVQRNDGFSIVMQLDDEQYEKKMNDMLLQLIDASEGCRVMFIRGCFDGRSSLDSKSHYLAVDVDRNYERQDIIVSIIESLDIETNKNRRPAGENRNDQIRIKPKSLSSYMSQVGFYSVFRNNIVNNYLQNADKQ